MDDFVNFILYNKYFSTGLVIALIILIVIFFIVLFSGKTKSVKKENNDETDKNDFTVRESTNFDTNFDHTEYERETTAEFELAPVSEVLPNTDESIPEVKEESQALKVETNAEVPVLKDFSFDELSKSISEELDKLKNEENTSNVEEETNQNPLPTFSSEIKEVNVTKFDDINNNFEEPKLVTSPEAPVNEFLTEEPVKEESFPVNDNENKQEPILKEENVPLFARFNQETYDINKKD